MSDYKLASRLTSGGTDVLAIHCGDFRFQSAFREFLSISLGLEGKYDLLVLPGGPLSLTLSEYLPQFSWASWKWTRFFVEQHQIQRLILIQHQDCSFYRTMPPHLHDSAVPRERQEQDLRRAVASVQKEFPHLSVELFYASWDTSDHIHIEAVRI